MATAALGALGLGLALGLRHALEPDHLAAVSALLADDPRGARPWRLGAAWGLGHGLALTGACAGVALLGAGLPAGVQAALELAVAAILIALGVANVARAFASPAGPPRPHTHTFGAHVHALPGAHVHAAGLTIATRPLLVGVVHGLAGSGALTALILGGSRGAGIAHAASLGLGAAVGMTALAGLVARPLAALSPRGRSTLAITTGLASVAFGVVWGLAPARALLVG